MSSTDKLFACEECDYAAKRKGALKQHYKHKHSDARPFACEHCEYTAKTNDALKKHWKSKHSTERPFACEHCEYTAKTNAALNSHYRHKHTNEKPFACKECEYTAKTKNALKKHCQQKHSDERPFHCKECDYTCKSSTALNSHYRHKHTNEKPFACKECDYTCKRMSDLKQHYKRKHSLQTQTKCASPNCNRFAASDNNLMLCKECQERTNKGEQCSFILHSQEDQIEHPLFRRIHYKLRHYCMGIKEVQLNCANINEFTCSTGPSLSYTYILLNGYKIANNPEWTVTDFMESIFYVGKGLFHRPEQHLCDAYEYTSNIVRKRTYSKVCQQIHNIWIHQNSGVYICRLVENVHDDIALALEYGVLEVLGIQNVNKELSTEFRPVLCNVLNGSRKNCPIEFEGILDTSIITLIKAYGAQLVLVDPEKGFAGVLERVDELQKMIPNSFVLNQFANESNIISHYQTTGPEIWEQTKGLVDIVCFGVGSGGTMSGVGKYLKEKNPKIQIYAVEPFESSVINGFPAGMHTIFGEPVLFLKMFGQSIRLQLGSKSEDAVVMAKRLAKEEGLLAGVSGGANVIAAIELAKRPENLGKLVVTSLADFGERYLSTLLYKDIKEECEKMGISTLEDNRKSLSKTLDINL